MTGTLVALMGLAVGNPNQSIDYGICYQQPPGALNTFQTYLTTTVTAVARTPYTATSTAAPGAGTYTVGYCVRNGGNAITSNDWLNGYIMITN